MNAVNHSPLPVDASELIIFLLLIAIIVAVAVASYRRSRCLSGYSVLKSLATAVLSGVFWEIWVIASIVKHQQLRTDWARYRLDRETVGQRRETQLVG